MSDFTEEWEGGKKASLGVQQDSFGKTHAASKRTHVDENICRNVLAQVSVVCFFLAGEMPLHVGLMAASLHLIP